MSRSTGSLLVALISVLSFSSVANAGWLHISSSVVQAEKEIQKHPAKLTQILVVPAEAVKAQVCVSYSNNLQLFNKGRVITNARIVRLDGSETSLKFVGGVKKSFYLNCKKQKKALVEGDMVVFDHQFKGFPRMRIRDSRAEFVGVSSIVSTAGIPLLGQDAPLGLVPEKGTMPLGILPSPGPGWFHTAKSVFQAEGDNQKHPESLAHTLLVPTDVTGVEVCAAYRNIAEDANAGRVVATARITQPDGTVMTKKMAGGVRDNDFLACKTVEGDLSAGAFVDFSYELQDMPRLDVTSDVTGFADVNGVISTSGEPVFREPPPMEPEPVVVTPPATPTTPTAPSTPVAPPPPTGGGGITAADETAVVRFFTAKSVQLQRPSGSDPAKYMAVGPKSKLLPGSGHKIDPRTAGISNSSIAAAVADYENKHKSKFPGGGSLDATTKSLVAWYANLNSAGGPTSVRHDAQGRFHGEYWRGGAGQQTATFSSLKKALEWLKSRGL